MFVIVQSWNSFASAVDGADLSHRFGVTLKHAGVAITVTSLTDFIAFAIGGLTVSKLDRLRSRYYGCVTTTWRPLTPSSGAACPEVFLHLLWCRNPLRVLAAGDVVRRVDGPRSSELDAPLHLLVFL